MEINGKRKDQTSSHEWSDPTSMPCYLMQTSIPTSISLLARALRTLNICPAVKDPIDAVLLDF